MIPPVIKPMEMTDLALPSTRVMPNAVQLHVLSGDENGAVRLELLFKGGYAVQEKPLQATFVNRMLREGAGSMSADEISQKLDYHGAWIETYSSQNCNHITLYALAKHFPELMELLEVLVKSPMFPQENLDVVRRNAKAYYAVNSKKVDVVSQRYFENALWGGAHPLGHIVEPCDYDALTRDDLVSYYNMVYGSKNCSIFISGSVNDALIADVEKRFGNEVWGCASALDGLTVLPPVSEPGRHVANVEETMQSGVKIGFMAMDSGSPDLYKFRFLTVLLGGYFGSRLMSNIREENGFTYHISAELDAYGKRNAFMISSETANQYLNACVSEIYREIEKLKNEPIGVEEVEHVRNYILGEMCREFEGLTPRSEVFVNTWLSGDDFSSVNEYLNTVRSVTPEELQQVARTYFNQEKMIEVVAGAV
jgi:predicted Zn-dependent peptidase